MTGPVAVLVDSSAGIGPALADRWNIGVVPIWVIFEMRSFRDGIDLTPAEFFSKLRDSGAVFETAAPAPADFSAAYDNALSSGSTQVFVITVSSCLSATYANARLAAEEFPPDTITVMDSGQGAGSQALIAMHAARAANAGESLPAVVQAAQDACQTTSMFMAVNTLRYVHRSGRISLPKALLGEAIRMKPILTFGDGRLKLLERPRTMRRAVSRLGMLIEDDDRPVADIMVMYADKPDSNTDELIGRLRKQVSAGCVELQPVSPVISGYTGPGMVGIAVRRGQVG